jgi:hypothetical protein
MEALFLEEEKCGRYVTGFVAFKGPIYDIHGTMLRDFRPVHELFSPRFPSAILNCFFSKIREDPHKEIFMTGLITPKPVISLTFSILAIHN